MKFIPSSLSARLLLAAGVLIVLALTVASSLTYVVLDHFMHHQVDQRLDAQVALITSALQHDDAASIKSGSALNAPPFDRPKSGWYWQVNGLPYTLHSLSLRQRMLPTVGVPPDKPLSRPTLGKHPPRPSVGRFSPPPPPDGIRPPPPDALEGEPPLSPPGHPRAIDISDAGRMLHIRSRSAVIAGRTVIILASAPQSAIYKPLGAAMAPVLIALAIAGIALLIATVAQVRLGLRPLARIRDAVADVRAGRAKCVPHDQPKEVAPLVRELNSLIVENSEGLERARRHVANLAHGLKTPLASLEIGLAELRGADAKELAGLAALMDRRIRHHLGRARIAALGGAARARTVLAPRLREICDAAGKIHAERKIIVTQDIAPQIAVACEMQDTDELFGNLIDNAFAWTRSSIALSATRQDAKIEILLDDDGPGLPDERMLDVLRPGQRLDESSPGYGFGLPIALELCELYGGSIALSRAPIGGLRVLVRLPASS